MGVGSSGAGGACRTRCSRGGAPAGAVRALAATVLRCVVRRRRGLWCLLLWRCRGLAPRGCRFLRRPGCLGLLVRRCVRRARRCRLASRRGVRARRGRRRCVPTGRGRRLRVLALLTVSDVSALRRREVPLGGRGALRGRVVPVGRVRLRLDGRWLDGLWLVRHRPTVGRGRAVLLSARCRARVLLVTPVRGVRRGADRASPNSAGGGRCTPVGALLGALWRRLGGFRRATPCRRSRRCVSAWCGPVLTCDRALGSRLLLLGGVVGLSPSLLWAAVLLRCSTPPGCG